MSLFWGRVTADAQLWTRRVSRQDGYRVSGYGHATVGDEDFDTVIVVALIRASSQESALALLNHTFPGGVISFCNPVEDNFIPSDRFPGMSPVTSHIPLLSGPDALRIGRGLGRIEASDEAHRVWMAQNAEDRRTNDRAARIIPQWPEPAPIRKRKSSGA